MGHIRIAEYKDKSIIQQFIYKYWSKGHILTISNKLFDYIYKNEKEEKYNFLLSFDDDKKELIGILGFIPTNHFDSEISDISNIVWYTMWKVLKKSNNKLEGLRLLRQLSKLFPKSNFGTVGANLDTIPIYKSFRYKTGILENFIALNPYIEDYKIAKIKKIRNLQNLEIDQDNIFITDISEDVNNLKFEINKLAKKYNQFKGFNYINKRYLNNPFFSYEIWMLKDQSSYSFLISRRIIYEGSSLVRIVDFIGDKSLLSNFKINLQMKLLKDSEYIEFKSYGLADELKEAGFIDITNNKEFLIPGYYDPFIFEDNIINWSIKYTEKIQFLVTGDCDQDRPNTLKNCPL